jgi:hypothetical protein
VTGSCEATDTSARRKSGFRIDPRIAWQQVDGQVVLLDLSDGMVVGMNPTASHVWPLLEGHDEDAIVDSVIDAFDVSPETARTDVRRFDLPPKN